jgi:hypothetical protein
VNPGTGLDVDECSWKGLFDVEASALAARLDTKEVGYVGYACFCSRKSFLTAVSKLDSMGFAAVSSHSR